jgi:hypothetical protein
MTCLAIPWSNAPLSPSHAGSHGLVIIAPTYDRPISHFSVAPLDLISGLVIESATYGPITRGAETAGLDVDVAPALQALVHGSQLYIPGGRPKVNR